MSNMISLLHNAISSVCPISGVSSDGRIDFKAEATEEQKTAARDIMSAYLANPSSWCPCQTMAEAIMRGIRSVEDEYPQIEREMLKSLKDEGIITDQAMLDGIKNITIWASQMYQEACNNPSTFNPDDFPCPVPRSTFGNYLCHIE